jgi:hypothetical protein
MLLFVCLLRAILCRSKLYAVGMRQSFAWGLYLVAGTTAQSMSIALSLLLGGSMVYNGAITAEQLTSFMFYVQVRGGGCVQDSTSAAACPALHGSADVAVHRV